MYTIVHTCLFPLSSFLLTTVSLCALCLGSVKYASPFQSSTFNIPCSIFDIRFKPCLLSLLFMPTVLNPLLFANRKSQIVIRKSVPPVPSPLSMPIGAISRTNLQQTRNQKTLFSYVSISRYLTSLDGRFPISSSHPCLPNDLMLL